jgi:hypothetical protein
VCRRARARDRRDGRATKQLHDPRDGVLRGNAGELVVGGPEILSRREIYERVAAVAQRRVRFVGVPVWLARIGTALLAPLHPRISQFGRFACGLARHDVIGDAVGTCRLDDYLASRAAMLR